NSITYWPEMREAFDRPCRRNHTANLETTFAEEVCLLLRNDEDEEFAGLYHVSRLDVDFPHGTGDLRRENVLHLHGFEDQQWIARIDLTPRFGIDHLEPLARHGRPGLGVAVRSRRPLRLELGVEVEREALAADRNAYAIGGARIEEANGQAIGAY